MRILQIKQGKIKSVLNLQSQKGKPAGGVNPSQAWALPSKSWVLLGEGYSLSLPTGNNFLSFCSI
jgi:hypothetical protein